MPKVSILHTHKNLAHFNDTPNIEPYNFKLYLPSTLPTNILCSCQLLDYEFKLCEAQAFEALKDIRQALCLCTYMYKYKDQQVLGQSVNTQCQNLLKHV